MKRSILVTALLSLSLVAALAQTAQSTPVANHDATIKEVAQLIREDLDANYNEITRRSLALDSYEKKALYAEFHENAVPYFLLNLFVGFGIGSMIQEDTVGGIRGLVGDCATAAMLGGAIYIFTRYLATSYSSSSYSYSEYATYGSIAEILFYAGYISFFVSRTMESIRPWMYAHSYNRTLKSALFSGREKITISLAPAAIKDELGIALFIAL